MTRRRTLLGWAGRQMRRLDRVACWGIFVTCVIGLLIHH